MSSSAVAALLEAPGDLSVLLVVAHPDDEMLGAATRLARLRRVSIVYVTDGAPLDMRDADRLGFTSREAYAEARTGEAAEGLGRLGAHPVRVERLDIVDQDAVLHLPEIVTTLARLIRELRPAILLTHAYEGGHPDHDATALAVYLAGKLIRDAGEEPPAILEFAGYHDPDGSGTMAVLEFLPSEQPVATVRLDPAEQDRKRAALACHRTQAEVLRLFPVDRERYRAAPAYDFFAPPHPWRPLYERFVTRLDGTGWRAMAAEALARFGIAAGRP